MLGRVIDPVLAFDGLPCSKEIKGEIAFQLIDSFLPENSGIYVLRAEDAVQRGCDKMVNYFATALFQIGIFR